MPERLSSSEISELEELIKQYTTEFEKIDKDLEALIGSPPTANAMSLESHSPELQKKILMHRDQALSTGYAVISTISNIIQRFRTAPASLLKIFIKLVNRFIALLTKYVGLFKIDSIEITISMTPSVVVTLKP
jgi:hypothetical protein